MHDRNTYFDYLRAIAIIMVVVIHTYQIDDSVILRQLVNAAVPIFVAISGFFVSKKTIENKSQYVVFLRRQIPKVYVPTLLFMTPMFLLDIVRGESFIKSLVYLIICNYSIYYFIAFIIQCYVVLPLLKSYVNKYKMGGGIISIIISILWIGSYTYLKNEYHMALPLIIYAGPLPCWLMFFFLGIYLGQLSDRKYSLSWPLFITCTGFILSVASCIFLNSGVGIKPTSFVYSLGLILVLFSSKMERFLSCNNIIYRVMIWLGRQSFLLYLAHMYIISLCLNKLDVSNWGVRICFTLLMTSILIAIFKWILPKSIRHWLGYSD